MERARCSWLHFDIMDNHFVPNLTFGSIVVRALRKITKKLFFDVHLMIENPLELVDEFAAAGVQNLTVHAEALSKDVPSALKTIKASKMRAGLSIKPKTPLATIEDALPSADLMLIMSVEPGFGGQALIPSTLNKVRALKKLREREKWRYLIEVDGGINTRNAEIVVAAGADVLVAGSAIFNDGNVVENVKCLREAIGNSLNAR